MADEYIRKADAVDELQSEPIFSDAWNALREARDRIKAIEPADVAPVVHAKWENYSPVTIKCSRCGHVIHDWRYSECKYCPNCGAKMDGERKEKYDG